MSEIANKKRSEISLEFGGEKFKSKITLNVLEKIEAEVDNNIYVTLNRLSKFDLSVTDIITIMTIAISETNASVTREQVGEALLEEGLGQAYELMYKILSPILGEREEEESGGNV